MEDTNGNVSGQGSEEQVPEESVLNNPASGKASEELDIESTYIVQDIQIKLISRGLKPRGDGLPGVPIVGLVALTVIVEDQEDIKKCVSERVLERVDCTACDGENYHWLPGQVLDYIFEDFQEFQRHFQTDMMVTRGELRVSSILSLKVGDSLSFKGKLNDGGYIKPEVAFNEKKIKNICLYGAPNPNKTPNKKRGFSNQNRRGRQGQFNPLRGLQDFRPQN